MIVLRRISVPLGARVPGSRTCSLRLVEFAGQWPRSEKRQFESNMRVIENFVSAEEEQVLMREIEPHISRLPYESSHWDEAIHGYREVERRKWSVENQAVLDRISTEAFGGRVMPFVHILDLAELGMIKPHVDSPRFCGNTIAGISLLSHCVMRLRRVTKEPDPASQSADVLLLRRSLYIMSALARYEFTHEILAREESWFRERLVERQRRVSVICRNEP
ncbi:alpha-ketoglutarate-dependent dioxygenase alkB homolog 7, mitochondrial [Drosophila biarmipes]|uniref:alpha-ketoglutarate-dependent dioxygenase alkB homolog 7, mitochondrial n=1 Tax=Drosophila biarmipes TaxID=125945 RepID=UPI0007E87983|nr:alpha-ketoglutarate-dependent dioxygenase alkB homolog 7, mitochondrial [Drosophila biarmipes]